MADTSILLLTPVALVAACLLALDAAVARRHGVMLAWCGLALGFGAEAWPFMPFVAAVLVNRKVGPRLWPLALLGYAIGIMLPHAATPGGAPNIWFVVETFAPQTAPALTGLALASAAGASACYIARFSARMPHGPRMLPVALLACLIGVALWPHAHSGEGPLASAIALAWAMSARQQRAWAAALLIPTGFALSLAFPSLAAIGLAAILAAAWLVAFPLLKPAANDNPLTMRTARRAPLHERPAM